MTSNERAFRSGSYAFFALLYVFPALIIAFVASFLGKELWKRYAIFLIVFILFYVGGQAYFASSVKLTQRGGHDGFVDLYVSGRMTLAGLLASLKSAAIICAATLLTDIAVRRVAQRL